MTLTRAFPFTLPPPPPFHSLCRYATQIRRLCNATGKDAKAPELPWQDLRVDSTDALSAEFAGEIAFSVPDGVDFISDVPNVHFSSVLAYHAASQTIHVDDTFNHPSLPPTAPCPASLKNTL